MGNKMSDCGANAVTREKEGLSYVSRSDAWYAGRRALVLVASLLTLTLSLTMAPAGDAAETPDKLELINLLKAGEWSRLERRLEAYQSAFENDRASDQLVEAAYLAFANSDQYLADHLDRWVGSAPGSYAALAARGVYYWRLGWMAHGSADAQVLTRAQTRLMRKIFFLAAQDLEAAIEIRPQFSLAYALLFDIGMASDQRDDQTFLMRRGLRDVPASFVIRERYLASLEPAWRPRWTPEQALSEIARFTGAIEKAATRFPRLRPLTGYEHYARAQTLFAPGHYATAKGLIAQALNAGQYWRYHGLAGRIQLQEGRCGLALLSFDLALAQRPQDAALYGLRGEVQRCMDNGHGALDEWDQALAFDAMEPRYLLGKGEALFLLGRYDDARKLLDQATFYGANDAAVRAARGALLVDRFGQFDAAAADFKLATEIEPGRVDYWLGYGDALYRANKCDAMAALATYVRLCKRSVACSTEDVAWATAALDEAGRSACLD